MSIRYLSGIDVDNNTLFVDDANNRVGIGTSGPQTSLDVQGSINIKSTFNLTWGGPYGAGTPTITGSSISSFISFYPAGSTSGETMRITSAGNVGIGTTSPGSYYANNLVVASGAEGGVTIAASGAGENYFMFADGTTGEDRYRGYIGYGHGSDYMRFGTNANERMRITSAGNVGIGTSSPVYKLQINASGGNGISLLGDVDNEASVLFGDSGSAVIGRLTYSNIDDSMRIFTNGSEKVRITSDGNVGIGTTTPLLTNVGRGNLTVNGSTSSIITLGVSNAWASYWYAEAGGVYLEAQGSRFISFATNSSSRMVITGAGNVGIGNTNPTAKLQVGAEVHPNATGIEVAAGAGGANLLALDSSTNHNWFPFTDGSNYYSAVSHTFRNELHSTDWMKITAAGNVGIGTTSPSSPRNSGFRPMLHVYNNSAGTNPAVVVSCEDNQMAGYIAGDNAGASDIGWGWNAYYQGSGNNFFNIRIGDNGTWTDRFTIDRYGNVGIGTTAPSARIHGFNDNFSTSQGFLFEGFRSTYDATSPVVYIKGNWEYISARATDPILKVAAYNDPNGFYILHNGNVGIGTTSPAYKLEVAGNVSFQNGKIFTISNASGNSLEIYHDAGDGANAWRHIYGGTGTGYGVGVGGYGIYYDGNSNYNQINLPNGNVSFPLNVGIGTTAPTNKLTVYQGGGVRVTGITSGDWIEMSGDLPGYSANQYPVIKSNGTIHFANNNKYSAFLEGANTYFGILDNTATTRVFLATSGNTYFTGGNVGIGTTSPNRNLTVSGNGTLLGLQSSTVGGYSEIEMTANGVGAGYIFKVSAGFSSYAGAGSLNIYNSNSIGFHTASATNAMFIASATGNVGIGTTAPTNVLHVVGVPRFDANGGAPSDTSGTVVNNKYYGNNFVALTSPNEWLKVDINGTAYVIPAYSI